jgi:alkaline phosphatase D
MAASAGLALVGCQGATIDPAPFDHGRLSSFVPDGVALSEALFPQTVSSGAMRADSVLLWTRAVGASTVVLKVWRPVGEQIALVHEQRLKVPAHGNVRVQVGTLAPATWYHYAFFDEAGTARSPIGKVRTAFPPDWKEPLVVSATSCASYRYRPFKPLVAMAEQPHDLWVHLGDVAYNDGADSLESFRGKWNEQLADPGYRALMPSAGGYLTWDDHDFFNNVDPEAVGHSQSIIAAGKEAFFESLPVEAGENGRLWRSYKWGQTAEFFILDARLERKPSTRETDSAQYLSRTQMDWLKAGLAASPCHFKVLLNSVPITNMPPPTWGGQADRWQGYASAREELLGFIDEKDIQNIWFLSGDFHLGLIMRVERDGPRSRLIEITAGPAGNVNPLWLVLEPGQEANKRVAFPPDQFLYAGGNFLNTLLTFDPRANTVRVVFTDPEKGETVCDQTLTFGQG